MKPVVLAELAKQQANWLATRQKVISENIANSDTPGYRAADIKPFSEILDQYNLTLSATQSNHLSSDPNSERAIVKREADSWDASYSGNSVSLEQQMIKSNEIRQSYALNTSITRAFHQMLLTSLKG